MKKLALLLFVLIATVAIAQTKVDNTSHSLKQIDVVPVPEKNVSLAEHFKKNFKPTEQYAEPIQVSFMIEKSGVLRDVKVFNKNMPEATKTEVIRVIKMLPRWKPGSKSGNTVRVLYTATLKS